jgi:hypothetical protein
MTEDPSAKELGVGSEGDLYLDADAHGEFIDRNRESQVSAGLLTVDDCSSEKIAESVEIIQEATDDLYSKYDSVADALRHKFIDAVDRDNQINSSFDDQAMAKSYVLKMIWADISGFDQLGWFLEDNPEIAEDYGFDPERIPHRTTFSTQWWERYLPAFRKHIRFEAARIAASLKGHSFNLVDDIDERINEFLPDEDQQLGGDIPEEYRIEENIRDRVFNEYDGLFNEILGYGRGLNKSIPANDLTELATFTSRRNETTLGGRDVYVSEHKVTDGNYMTSEALAKPIRQYSRHLAEQNYMQKHAIPPTETAYDWSVNPEDRDFGEGESWHKRTEQGIEKQVKMLQSRGMLDRPLNLCVDGTARTYNNRNDTDVDEPDGVLHRYQKYETGYAWEDITITAIYRGRAIVLANISKVKNDEQFQCVRYLIDRARDLVNVRNIYADSEFGTSKICSYIDHVGTDYVMKKRKSEPVKEFLDATDERVDWTDYVIKGGDGRTHKTTLVALEKKSKAVTKKGEKRRGQETNDGTEQSILPGVEEPEDEDSEKIVHESFITSYDIEGRGLDPQAAGPRREAETAFSIGQLYRKRWAVETAFRDIKQNFKAKPRSRCLGVRRFFFMLCLLLYNCWVLLNIIVADEADHRADDEIIWRKKIFIIDIHRDVFSHREPD